MPATSENEPQGDTAAAPPPPKPTPRRARGKRLPEGWKERFLDAYSQIGSVTGGARMVGIDRSTVYDYIERDPRFAESFAQADKSLVDRGVQEVVVRGIYGWDEPVYGQVWDPSIQQKVTGQVGVIRRFDAKLLLAFLAAKDPERWGARARLEHSGPAGGPIAFEVTDEFRREVEALMGEMASREEARAPEGASG